MSAAFYFALFMAFSVALALFGRRYRGLLNRPQRWAFQMCTIVAFVCAGMLFVVAISGDEQAVWLYEYVWGEDGRRAKYIILSFVLGYLSSITASLFILGYALTAAAGWHWR